MKDLKLFFILAAFIAVSSCTNDTGTIKVTYTKATAIYSDGPDFRVNDLNKEPIPIENAGKVYIGEDYILIGEEKKGIHVIANNDVSNPDPVNFIEIPGNLEFIVKDDIIYADNEYDMLKIDISDLNDAKIINRAEFVFAQELVNHEGKILTGFDFNVVTEEIDETGDLYSEISKNDIVYFDFADKVIPPSSLPVSFAGNSNESVGTANRITLLNDHVYVAGRFDINILNDDAFTLVNTMRNVGNEMETIFAHEDHLFVGSRSSMFILKATNAASPEYVYEFDHARACDPVLASSGAAYVTLRTGDFSACPGNTNALVVIDITDLAQAQYHTEFQMQSPYGLAKIGNKLYVGEGNNGLSIFDVSEPLNPVLLDSVSDMIAFDIIEHPTNPGLILVAGPNGVSQYITDDTQSFTFQSRIDF